MAFTAREIEVAGGRAWELAGPDARAEVWPSHGFNCLRWAAGGDELLYAAPDWAERPVPTRSGTPILFPFPGRIRDGHFTYGGRAYRLPPTDSGKKNAHHGFTPRNRWEVTDSGGGADGSWVQGTFHLSRRLENWTDLWPADFVLKVTCRLTAAALRFEAEVHNPGEGLLPFGLGYHPYFRPPAGAAGETCGRFRLRTAAAREWVLDGGLPTGELRTPDAGADFSGGREVGGAELDHLYRIDQPLAEDGELLKAGELSLGDSASSVEVWAGPEFRDLILFTPPNRESVAVEPYTTIPDAINLGPRGVDAGLRELPAGQVWRASVEFRRA